MLDSLNRAWKRRENLGLFHHTDALRIFHGPGDGETAESQHLAIDRFANHYWVTQWESASQKQPSQGRNRSSKHLSSTIVEFLRTQGAASVVALTRPEKGLPAEPTLWFGQAPDDRFTVLEDSMKFWIQLLKVRHPGLFLDHAPLRQWLLHHVQGMQVLNTFAYTGSLSVAAGLGKAEQVTTLDLSQPSVQWAEENWKLNHLIEAKHRLIAGDVFEWLPRLKREKQRYDCIILDPPSFSHGKKQRFSTSKDLEKLHSLALELLSPQGILVTSINSANVSWKKYESDLLLGAKKLKTPLNVLKQIDLPESFPTRLGDPMNRYLKGWILQKI